MAPSFVHAAALALRASSAALCPTSPTCPQDDQCIYTANGASLQVSCATDFYGGDLTLAQTSTLERCMTLCASTSTCVAASYVGQNCYLKSTLTSAQPNANVVGVAVTTRSSSPPPPATTPGAPGTCPSSFTCPENDGCSFTGGLKALTLTCGTDFYGGDLSSQYAGSLQECTQACASNADCVAASFTGGKGPGYCYLKSQKNGASNNDYVDAVYVTVASTPTSSTVQSSTTPSATPSLSSSSSSSSIGAQSTTSASATPSLSSTSTELSTSASSAPAASSTSSATPISSAAITSPSSSSIGAQSTTSAPATPSLSSTSTELSTSASPAPASSSTSSSTPISSATITSPSTIATPTPTPSTSSTAPSAPQYTNFCLRVTTPTSPAYGVMVRNGNPSQNLILGNPNGFSYPVVFFTLESTGRIVTTTGFPLSPYQPNSPYSVLRPFTQANIDRNPTAYAQEYCTVTQSAELVCVAKGGSQQSVFVRVGSNVQLSTATAGAINAQVVALNLGVFFGDKCVDGSSL